MNMKQNFPQKSNGGANPRGWSLTAWTHISRTCCRSQPEQEGEPEGLLHHNAFWENLK